MVASAIKRAQKRFGKENNSLILVLPYTVADMEYLEDFYDEIWIPDELHGVHFKNAITKRNEWFVNNSNLLIAYVLRDKGGAATCLKMAEKQKILTVNIADNKDIYWYNRRIFSSLKNAYDANNAHLGQKNLSKYL